VNHSIESSQSEPLTPLPEAAIVKLAEQALQEDLDTAQLSPTADLTTAWTVGEQAVAEARIIARQPGVLAGTAIAAAVFLRLDPELRLRIIVDDGASVQPQDVIIRLNGKANAILTGERVALNFMQRLSGTATLTRSFVNAVEGTGARITDTRKTTPGLRLLEKHAVVCGGGVNHRMGLFDAVLIKENHAAAAGGVGQAARQARMAAEQLGRGDVPIMVEADSLDDVRELLSLARLERPDRILLDNMSPDLMRQALHLIRAVDPPIRVEATGNIDLSTVRGVADVGPDLISIGALTHSAPALDLSLLFDSSLGATGVL
jgi:nicotinate-nucleotide pyrophosphorylase (carboxylating)